MAVILSAEAISTDTQACEVTTRSQKQVQDFADWADWAGGVIAQHTDYPSVLPIEQDAYWANVRQAYGNLSGDQNPAEAGPLIPGPLALKECGAGNDVRTGRTAGREQGYAPISRLELQGIDSHDPIMTNTVRKLMRVLWSIVVSRALQVGFPVGKTAVSIIEDPEEQDRKAVLRVICDTRVSQALAFWDSLEPDLQGWLSRLSERERRTFLSKISLRIHWRS